MLRNMLLSSCALVALSLSVGCGGGAEAVDRTVATAEPIRGELQLGAAKTRIVSRVAPGEAVEVGEAGLAKLSLDGGAALLLGNSGRLTIHDSNQIELTAGRVFITIEGGERLRIQTPRGSLGTTTGAFSIRIADGNVAVYVIRGDLGFGATSGHGHGVVRAGEQLLLSEGEPQVDAALVWSDWTGGLARPGVGDEAGPAGMGTLEARIPGELGTARHHLLIRRLAVNVVVRGDLAITEIEQVFFNTGPQTVEGLYRFRAPTGAVLQRFAIDRGGRLVEAYVRERQQAQASYQAQVYQGSTDDPALLEWDAPGAYHARIYPIESNQSRRIVVRYAEWLVRPSSGASRLYRYPMGQGGRPPYIEEFSLTLDLSEADAGAIRAGLGATVTGSTVQLRHNDFRPRADFWLELSDGEASTSTSTKLRAFRARHQQPRRAPGSSAPEGEQDERDYALLPLVLPLDLAGSEASQGRLDLVVVADVSAATEPSHLELTQTMVEALATHLGPEDRIAVVASDLTIRSVIGGEVGEQLGPASPERIEQLLTGLARVAAGGATDLGAAIAAAGDLLDPQRRGAVVYVGDGAPTVGELQTADLLERIARLPTPARLYGVAVGSEANLDLLAALTRGRGLAMRIEVRRAAAEAALRILAHASRPMAREVTVHFGTSIENVYPTGPADVVLGDVLTIIGRLERGSNLPTTVRVTGTVGDRAFDEEVALDVQTVDDSGDLRLRWANERLRHLLIEGVPRETVVELGTRYGLITPYTSYYVPSERELRNMGEISLLYAPLEMRTQPRFAASSTLTGLATLLALPLALNGCFGEGEPMMEQSAMEPASPIALAPATSAQPAPSQPAFASPAMEEAEGATSAGSGGLAQVQDQMVHAPTPTPGASGLRGAAVEPAPSPSPVVAGGGLAKAASPPSPLSQAEPMVKSLRSARPSGGRAGAVKSAPRRRAESKRSRGKRPSADLDALLDGALGAGGDRNDPSIRRERLRRRSGGEGESSEIDEDAGERASGRDELDQPDVSSQPSVDESRTTTTRNMHTSRSGLGAARLWRRRRSGLGRDRGSSDTYARACDPRLDAS